MSLCVMKQNWTFIVESLSDMVCIEKIPTECHKEMKVKLEKHWPMRYLENIKAM